MSQQPSAPERRMSRSILLTVLLLGMLAAGFVFLSNLAAMTAPPTPTPQIEGVTNITPPLALSDFTLTNHEGDPMSLSDFQGKWALLFFGYTHCPDYCPNTLAEFRQIREQLGEQADEVQFVFLSVDGTRDTPEVLANYLRVRQVEGFVTALTGTEDEVREVGTEYGLFFEKAAETADLEYYIVDHTTQTYLIDPEGNLRVIYNYTAEPDVIVADMQQRF